MRFRSALLPASAAALLAGCAPGRAGVSAPPRPEWVSLRVSAGNPLPLLVLRPAGPARGVVLAFPWGAGDAGLLAGLVETYWDEAAPAAGYAVVGVQVRGPSLESRAEAVMPAVLEWLDANLAEAADHLVLTGASAGGIGVFHAALAMPDRVDSILAMPGRYGGEASLEVLAGVPVRLVVGERDRRWVRGSEATAQALEAAGARVSLEILPGQGHVLAVAQRELLRRIEEDRQEPPPGRPQPLLPAPLSLAKHADGLRLPRRQVFP